MGSGLDRCHVGVALNPTQRSPTARDHGPHAGLLHGVAPEIGTNRPELHWGAGSKPLKPCICCECDGVTALAEQLR
jgi:hypothetical protein